MTNLEHLKQLINRMNVEDFGKWYENFAKKYVRNHFGSYDMDVAWAEREYKNPLKPCPFCGSEAELTKPDDSHYFARCTNPECIIAPATIITRSKEKIIEAWNRRVSEK